MPFSTGSHSVSSRRFSWQTPLAQGMGALLTTVLSVMMAAPGRAADRLYVSFGPIERSITTSSLETYVQEGVITSELRPYARYASPEQLAQLREILATRIDLSPVAISQFLYTDQGEKLLNLLGAVIRTEARLPGGIALRAALVQAANDPETGLTPLNVLQKFPVSGIRIDLEEALRLAGSIEDLVSNTKTAIAAIEQSATTQIILEPPSNFSDQMDLRDPGPYGWQKQTIMLDDRQRDRVFPADIYLPVQHNRPLTLPAPVIVISHGLGSNRDTFAYLAKQLTSYGFVVAVPEHPGSNTEQLEALISGRASEVTQPAEFINRPQDIQFLLDELERLAKSDPTYLNRLNAQRVGVIGQSFGGYTALVLAGATFNLDQLIQDCIPDDTLNLSLLLQCRALELPPNLPELRDRRVKAIFAINPMGSSLLGQSALAQLDMPVMIASSGADTVTPALLEQIQPFTWLTTASRYLLLLKNGTHFSAIDVPDGEAAVSLPSEVVGPNPAIAHQYLNAMSVAFFGTYLTNSSTYRPYLSAAYAEHIKISALPLSLVNALSSTDLTAEALAETTAESASR